MRHLEPAELHALLDAAVDDPVAEMILYLVAYSGLRRGEAFAVQWGDLDEDACQLRIRRSIYQGDLTRPKTETSARRVDLPMPILTRLRAYREQFPPVEKKYVFRTDKGTPLDPDNWFRRVFVPIAIRAKLRPVDITGVDDADLVGLHTLRHTYASLLIAAGENIKYVSRQLGHASVLITLNTYAHLLKETSTSAMARLAMRIPVVKPADEIATSTDG